MLTEQTGFNGRSYSSFEGDLWEEDSKATLELLTREVNNDWPAIQVLSPDT